MTALSKLDLGLPFSDLFPPQWKQKIPSCDYLAFRNLDHFRYVASELKPKNNMECGMSYENALKHLVEGTTDFPESEQMSIRNLVRSNLHKRGLITEETYEAYRYAVDGIEVGIDIGKYANGEPDCVITPARVYVDFFYELYISVSYPHHVKNETVRENVAKLLATIEELERQHIWIKIMLVLPVRAPTIAGKPYMFSSVPLFSHKEYKSVATMSSVVNERLLRKFYFAMMENLYKEDLLSHYGYAEEMPTAMSIGNKFNEIEFFENIVESVGADK